VKPSAGCGKGIYGEVVRPCGVGYDVIIDGDGFETWFEADELEDE
jgi:hypothetical protein